METHYWIGRWEDNEIGWHRPTPNAQLQRYWDAIEVDEGATVFVPLCGKSVDLHWFAERGYRVIGNEVAEKAVAEFFAEAQCTPEVSQEGEFRRYRHGAIEILCGDFFSLTAEHLAGATAWYDRAAQVALPPSMRERYYTHLSKLLPAEARGLTLGLEYPQEQKEGPPFSVEEEEVCRLGEELFEIELLLREDRLPHEPRLVQQGLTRADETVYRMVRR